MRNGSFANGTPVCQHGQRLLDEIRFHILIHDAFKVCSTHVTSASNEEHDDERFADLKEVHAGIRELSGIHQIIKLYDLPPGQSIQPRGI